MKKLGLGLLIAGAVLEVIDRASGPTVSSNPDIAQYQAQIVNLNRTFGDFHISYALLGAGAYLWLK
jgi:hypothetical protein